MARTLKSITVAELIEELEGQDPEAMVVFASDYGDIGHTRQVHFINGELEPLTLEESAYSDSGWAVADTDDEEGEQPTFLVLQ